MKASLVTNGRYYKPRAIAREITLQETQGLKTFLTVVLTMGIAITALTYIISTQTKINVLESENLALASQINNLQNEKAQINADKVETIAEYNSTINELNVNINDLVSNIENSNNVIEALDGEIATLLADNKDLARQYDDLLTKHETLSSREELFDKYEYVIKYNGKRTDVTYDQIKTAEDMMLEKGYDPNILFSIIMVESKGVENRESSRSTATGYGQFLSATGKYTYEQLMGNGTGTYNHSMAKNGDINIQMTYTYLDYLFTKTNKDLFKSIKSYSGGDNEFTSKYISWMRKYVPINGVNAA